MGTADDTPRFRVLGPVELFDGERWLSGGGRRQQTLLAYLLLHADRAVSSDGLVAALWHEGDPAGALKRLQVAVARLRRRLGQNERSLQTVGGGYRLAVADGQLDADVFRAMAQEGHRALAAGEPARAEAHFNDAIGLWRGPAYADIAFEEFAQIEIRLLDELRLTAVEGRVDAELQLGHHARLTGELESLVAAHPARELLTAQLMTALYRSGRQADALAVYQRARTHLVTELGLEPGPALAALEAEILAHAPSLELREPQRRQPATRGWVPHATSTVPLQGMVPEGFIGRAAERAALRHAWEQARSGRRTLVLVSGEAGIGKTRIASELARAAADQSACVIYGRSDEDVGMPYEPWRQALGQLVELAPEALLRQHAEQHGGALCVLTPTLGERVGLPSAGPENDPETQRGLLFGAVLGLLTQVSHAAPVVLILDDLHWAGRATLALVKHVQFAAPAMRLLIVGTFRHGAWEPGSPLTVLLGDLRREPDSTRIERLSLTGLDEGEVLSLVRATSPHETTTLDQARRLRSETEGNPFFVAEIARHLDESGATVHELPGSVKEVIAGRVARLGADAVTLLTSAAVIGREFDLGVLRELQQVDDEVIIDVLERAAAASLISEHADPPERYSFVHALAVDALSGNLTAARRARVHERIAEVLEAGRCGEAPPALIARHWAEGTSALARRNAVDSAGRAGWAALEQLAPHSAAGWFSRALEGLASAGGDEAARRELLLGLGQAQLDDGDPEFRSTLLTAAELAEAAGDHDRLVRAALANTRGYFSSAGFVDEERVEVLESALAHALPDDPCRAKLLALLAAELLWSPEFARRRAISDEALTLARLRGDVAALAHVLTMRVTAIWAPETLAERLAVTEEALALAEPLGDPVQDFWAHVWRAITLVQAGEVAGADEALGGLRALTARLHQARLSFVLTTQEAWRAQLRGDLTEAERLVDEAAAIGDETGEPDAQSLYVAQLGPLRWHQGRLGEEADLLALVAEGVPNVSSFTALSALAEYEADRPDSAQALLDARSATGFAQIPRDPVTLSALVIWAEVAASLGDRVAARALLECLTPFTDHVVIDALGTFGAVSRAAGRLAATVGDTEQADAHLDRALATHERIGADALCARTRIDWGGVLAEAGDEEMPRARRLLSSGADAAEKLGIERLVRRAAEALARIDRATDRPQGRGLQSRLAKEH